MLANERGVISITAIVIGVLIVAGILAIKTFTKKASNNEIVPENTDLLNGEDPNMQSPNNNMLPNQPNASSNHAPQMPGGIDDNAVPNAPIGGDDTLVDPVAQPDANDLEAPIVAPATDGDTAGVPMAPPVAPPDAGGGGAGVPVAPPAAGDTNSSGVDAPVAPPVP